MIFRIQKIFENPKILACFWIIFIKLTLGEKMIATLLNLNSIRMISMIKWHICQIDLNNTHTSSLI